MGVDIHFYITKYNKEKNIFEEIALYTAEAGKYKKVPVFIGRNYEMFDILRNKTIIDKIDFPSAPIVCNSLEEELKNTIKKYIGDKEDFTSFYSFLEVNLADLKNYVNTCPTMVNLDYDSEEEETENNKKYKTNPVKFLYDEIINYINFADFSFDFTPYSYYKILYFFDC